MRYIYKLLPILLFVVSSCQEYLDITPKGSMILETADEYYDLITLPNRGYYPGQFHYLADEFWMKESNVVGVTPNLNIANFTFDETFDRVNSMTISNFYNQAYVYINRWNIIIDLVDYSQGSNAVKELAKAEAKILRAFDHFMLVNVHAKAYNPATAATDGGICIMAKYDLEAQPYKSTVQEVYDFIQRDIDEAMPYIQEKTKDVYHPNLAFAWAFKARVHLYKHEYDKALEAAIESQKYNKELYDLAANAYNSVPTLTAANNPEVLSFMYASGHSEMTSAWSLFLTSPELVSLFEEGDCRFRNFFTTTNSVRLDVGSGAAAWNVAYTKFFYPTVGMKTGEVYLIIAECYARSNKLSEATAIINTLREKRIVGNHAIISTPATKAEMMEIVINERRKELMFGCNRFFDMKRLNTESEYAKTVVRKYPLVRTDVEQKTYKLAPNSRMYIVPFPQNAMLKNPNLTLNTDEKLPW